MKFFNSILFLVLKLIDSKYFNKLIKILLKIIFKEKLLNQIQILLKIFQIVKLFYFKVWFINFFKNQTILSHII